MIDNRRTIIIIINNINNNNNKDNAGKCSAAYKPVRLSDQGQETRKPRNSPTR